MYMFFKILLISVSLYGNFLCSHSLFFSFPPSPPLPHSHIFESQHNKVLKATENSTSHEILAKLLHIFVPQLSVCKTGVGVGAYNYIYLPEWLWGLNTFVYVECLEQRLMRGKYFVNFSYYYDYMTFPFRMIPSPFPVSLSKNYIYSCCLIFSFLWTLLEFFPLFFA